MYEYNLSFIVPVFNEEMRIKKNFNEYISFVKNFKKKELIFVDDGSADNTKKVLEKLSKKFNFIKILTYKKNMGKGYAIRKGILSSKFENILFSDCDLSTPLNEFKKFGKYIKNYDIIIGSRDVVDSNVLKKQSFVKEYLGKLSNILIRIFLQIKIYDTQCGFKFFKKNTLTLFQKQKNNRFGFDFEILFLAKKYNFKVKEVGVVWVNCENSKVKKIDYIKTLFELFKVRIFDILKKY